MLLSSDGGKLRARVMNIMPKKIPTVCDIEAYGTREWQWPIIVPKIAVSLFCSQLPRPKPIRGSSLLLHSLDLTS